MKIYSYFLLFILCFYFTKSEQPNFPSQILFSPDNGITTLAIDEINQRVYQSIISKSILMEVSYAFKNFPYALVDSPQSKYYVQLLIESPSNNCQYGTYWKYAGNNFNILPAHWWINKSSFEIKNYMNFKYQMIHSINSSQYEDYWYSNVTCQPDTGIDVPYEEIYFKKNTEIPRRFVQVVRRGWDLIQVTTNYQIISIGKPDEKYFDSIPKNWFIDCRDYNLGLLYYPQATKINISQSVDIHITLTAPPHRINGSDTVSIRWNVTSCNDCFTYTSKQIDFNDENFQEEHILTITRVKYGPKTSFIPIFIGGSYDLVPNFMFTVDIE